MKISKTVREQAVMICAIAASAKSPNGRTSWGITSEVALALDEPYEGQARRLADSARAAAATTRYANGSTIAGDEGYEIDCAEAEALLRTGWSPS